MQTTHPDARHTSISVKTFCYMVAVCVSWTSNILPVTVYLLSQLLSLLISLLYPVQCLPRLRKRQNIDLNVLLKLELMKNRKGVVLQQTFSSNRPPFPFYNLLNWGPSVCVFLCIYLCWQVPGHSRSISICCFCLYKSSLHTPIPLALSHLYFIPAHSTPHPH